MKVITHNQGKYREIKEVFEEIGIKTEWINMSYPEIQCESLNEVVKFGIEYLKPQFDDFIIDDSGLFIKALNNFPGVYSSYVFKTLGLANILKLLDTVKARDAYFQTVIGLKLKDKVYYFEGVCKGKIGSEIKGTHGFGYDPIFIPKNSNKSFGEMNVPEKNEFSHRAKAIRKLLQFYQKEL